MLSGIENFKLFVSDHLKQVFLGMELTENFCLYNTFLFVGETSQTWAIINWPADLKSYVFRILEF